MISLFGFDEPRARSDVSAPGEFHLVDGMPHCISPRPAARLKRLSKTYELVWASGWEDRANDYLPNILGLPELPYLTFDGGAVRHGALEARGAREYAATGPLAWIDDSFDDSCHEWAEQREAPTLLVPTESERGLEEAHVDTLEPGRTTAYSAS